MFALQRFIPGRLVIASTEQHDGPMLVKQLRTDDNSIHGRSDHESRRVLEPGSLSVSTGDITSLAILAQCVP
jgi:hypothetical protein